MKLGVNITAYNEKQAVNIVKHFEPHVDRVVVGVTRKAWFGEVSPDDTAERLVRETDAAVMCREWETEHEQRNDTMDLLRDMDYVIVSHCDTWFTAKDLLKLKRMDLEYRNYTTHVYTYWKDYDTVIYPHLSLPTIIVRSDSRFHHLLNIWDGDPNPDRLPITCHHVSWVKTDKEVQDKIASYSHADEIGKDWYENVWKNWTSDMKNFGPTTPEDFKTVVKHSLPQEIRKWHES